MKILKTIRKYIRARNIRSIRIMKWTERFIPIIQEENPIANPGIDITDLIEQAAYLRAVSWVDLQSDLARIRKSELIFTRMIKLSNLPQDIVEVAEKLIEQKKRERLERLFHV